MKPLLVPIALLLLATISSAQEAAAPDIVLLNGRVFTADPANRWAEAIAIRGDRIAAVGTTSAIKEMIADSTKRIDLKGRLVIPGINDAHTHQAPTPEHFSLSTSPKTSVEDLTLALGSGGDETPSTLWLMGTVGPSALRDPALTEKFLDKATANRNAMLSSYTGHGRIFSATALITLHIRENASDPAGGWFERDPSGRLTGKAFEYAGWNTERRMNDSISDDEAIDQLRTFAATALRYGITSVQNMALLPLSRYEKIVRHAEVPLRIRMIRFPATDADGRDVREGRDLPMRDRERPLSPVSGIKWILDGTPVEEGAALARPYHAGSDATGRLNFPPDEIAKMLSESLANNDQLLLHVAGDRTANVVLQAMKAMPDVDWKAKRVRFEHGDGVFGDRIAMVRDLGIVIVQNPAHFADLGDYPTAEYSPMKSLIRAGVHLALGSDGPMNPYLNIMLATSHPRASESLSREEAVEAYTREAAYAEFAEADKGTIAAGKLADLTVLSQDIFRVPASALPVTCSLLTIDNGTIAYDAGEISPVDARPHRERSRP